MPIESFRGQRQQALAFGVHSFSNRMRLTRDPPLFIGATAVVHYILYSVLSSAELDSQKAFPRQYCRRQPCECW